MNWRKTVCSFSPAALFLAVTIVGVQVGGHPHILCVSAVALCSDNGARIFGVILSDFIYIFSHYQMMNIIHHW